MPPRSRRVLAEHYVVVPATEALLDTLHATLVCFWAVVEQRPLCQLPDSLWRIQLETAAAEIGANILRHAYGGGNPQAQVSIAIRQTARGVVVRFLDCGAAFSAPVSVSVTWGATLVDADLLSDTLELEQLAEGGMGLGVARAAVDHLSYRRAPGGWNCWRLTKLLPQPPVAGVQA